MKLVYVNDLVKQAYPFPCAIDVECAVPVRAINEAPTIDPVHAAGGCYCRECKYSSESPSGCSLHEIDDIQPSDFCSYGEPIEQEEARNKAAAENPMYKYTKISLNDKIKVKLSKKGQDIFWKSFDDINKEAGREVIAPRYCDVDENGYSEFQLWDFMALFGSCARPVTNGILEQIEIFVEIEEAHHA